MGNAIFPDRFKTALTIHQVQIGCWCVLIDPISTKVLGLAGFGWLVLGMEYVPNDVTTFILQLMALKGSSSVQVVRVPTNESTVTKYMLDISFYNFLMSLVGTAEQTAQTATSTRYPLEGIRGVPVFHRGNMFGTVPDYFVQPNKNISTLMQIESQTGVDNVEAIAATEGVDGVFVGPSDLAAILGHLGNVTHPEVWHAIQHISVSTKKHGKLSGIPAPVEVDTCRYLEWEATFIAVDSDLDVFHSATQKLADASKK